MTTYADPSETPLERVNKIRSAQGRPVLTHGDLVERNRLVGLYRDGDPEERDFAREALRWMDRRADDPQPASPARAAEHRQRITQALRGWGSSEGTALPAEPEPTREPRPEDGYQPEGEPW